MDFGATLEPSLAYEGAFWGTVGSLWGCFGVTLGPFGGHFGYIRITLGYFHITLRSLRDHFGCIKVEGWFKASTRLKARGLGGL